MHWNMWKSYIIEHKKNLKILYYRIERVYTIIIKMMGVESISFYTQNKCVVKLHCFDISKILINKWFLITLILCTK